MKELLAKQKYNPGKQLSEHNIGEKSFLTNNAGDVYKRQLLLISVFFSSAL